MNQAQIIPRDIGGGKSVPTCSECGSMVPPAYGSQEPDNRFYRKRVCPGCGAIFEWEGPYRTMADAAPARFK